MRTSSSGTPSFIPPPHQLVVSQTWPIGGLCTPLLASILPCISSRGCPFPMFSPTVGWSPPILLAVILALGTATSLSFFFTHRLYSASAILLQYSSFLSRLVSAHRWSQLPAYATPFSSIYFVAVLFLSFSLLSLFLFLYIYLSFSLFHSTYLYFSLF